MPARIQIDRQRIAEFCRRWKNTEFALFGSALRDDFRPDSDVDVLVRYEPGSPRSLSDLVHMGTVGTTVGTDGTFPGLETGERPVCPHVPHVPTVAAARGRPLP